MAAILLLRCNHKKTRRGDKGETILKKIIGVKDNGRKKPYGFKTGKVLLTLTLCSILLMIGCGKKKTDGERAETLAATLNVYNWSEYICFDVLKDFEKEYKVKVNYDTFSSNEELLAKLMTGAQGYDVIFPSDYMVETMVILDLLAPINKDNIPNLKNIEERFLDLFFDPENHYTVPYMWGTTGIALNTKYVSEDVDSWSIFWNPQYKGRISLLNDMRETIGMAMKLSGYSLNSTDWEELAVAGNLLKENKALVKVYDSEDYRNLLLMEEIWLAQAYSGDAVMAIEEDPNLIYIFPKEGVSLWIDNMAIPKNAPNKYTAEIFINFLLRPDISARLTEEIMYGNPNYASFEFTPQELLNNEAIFPGEEALQNSEWLFDLGEGTTLYDRIWTEIKGQ